MEQIDINMQTIRITDISKDNIAPTKVEVSGTLKI
jgi:hypothetical protein